MVAISSVEAEYIALANIMKKVVWLRTLLKKMDFLQITGTIIFAGNQSYITFVNIC